MLVYNFIEFPHYLKVNIFSRHISYVDDGFVKYDPNLIRFKNSPRILKKGFSFYATLVSTKEDMMWTVLGGEDATPQCLISFHHSMYMRV